MSNSIDLFAVMKRSRVILGLVSRDRGVVRCATGVLPVAHTRRIRPCAAGDVAEVQICRVFETLSDGSVASHVVPLLNVLAEASVMLERALCQMFCPRVPVQRVAVPVELIVCVAFFAACCSIGHFDCEHVRCEWIA